MVVIKIEMWPGGDKTRASDLGVVVIVNDGTGTEEFGNYDVHLSHAGEFFGKPGVWKEGKIKQHRRALSPYHLVLRALQAALGNQGRGE